MADPKPFCKALKEFWLQICRKRSTTEYQENRRTEEELFWSGARTAVLANLRIRYVVCGECLHKLCPVIHAHRCGGWHLPWAFQVSTGPIRQYNGVLQGLT
uniref:Uncharacterized protein n=1 Tax=Oryza nivara TaxID=4536 RepID=A0A0E0IZ94_ORYNI